jgi:hypothetical protein
MAVIDAFRFRATTRFAVISESKYVATRFLPCPVPECGKTTRLTHSGHFAEHVNSFGFHCDATGLTPQAAAHIRVDAAGRLIGIDETKQRVEADE